MNGPKLDPPEYPEDCEFCGGPCECAAIDKADHDFKVSQGE
jgi:hypothetical protein